MIKHKKRISVLTLAVFILMTVFSGFGSALALEKAPVTKGEVTKPSSDNSYSSGSGGSLESGNEAQMNLYGITSPHLDSLIVDSQELINNSADAINKTRSATVLVETFNIVFDPHECQWSQWWEQGQSNQHFDLNLGQIRTIPNITLSPGQSKIFNIKVANGWGNANGESSPNFYRTYVLTVTRAQSNVLVTNVNVNPASEELYVGENTTLEAIITPDTATDTSVTWTSSNNLIATVDSNGLVTAVGPGTATITATVNDGSGKYGTCSVTVIQLVTSVVVSPSSTELLVGETETLSAAVYPANASDTSVTWTSSNNLIATVDSNGLVTAVGPGTATITATANDGSGKYGTCSVTVIQLVTKIEIDPAINLRIGDTKTLSLTVEPDNASNPSVTWTSDDESVATVNAATGLVTGISSGTATITATANDGSGKSDTCLVTVWDLSLTVPSDFFLTAGGDSKYLTATPYPAGETVFWGSENNSGVVSVDEETGEIKPLAAGTADITARIYLDSNTYIEEAKSVTVYAPIELSVTAGPELNSEGVYEATFGYKSNYPFTVYSYWPNNKLSDNDVQVIGHIPTTFDGTNNSAFSVKYKHKDAPLTWTVIVDGATSEATAVRGLNPAIQINPNNVNLIVNGSGQLLTALVESGGFDEMTTSHYNPVVTTDIKWEIISGSRYVAISKTSGSTTTVTPKWNAGAGEATIKATFAGKTATCKVVVWDMELDQKPGMPMTAGGYTRTIHAKITPSNVSNSWPVTWKTDNASVATVAYKPGRYGVITPKGVGTAKIWAEMNVDGKIVKSDKFTVRVVNPIDVFVSDPVLNENGTYTATFGYTSYYDNDIYIHLSNDNRLSNGGFVTPPTKFKKGTHNNAFSVTYLHSKSSPSWTVKYDGVRDTATAGKKDINQIVVNGIPEEITLVSWGASETLTALIQEEMTASHFGGYTSDIIWTIEQEGNIIRDYNHRGQSFTVYPRDPGTARVTAQFADGDSATCNVTVVDPRTISISPDLLVLRERRDPGTVAAAISSQPEAGSSSTYNWGIDWSTNRPDLIRLEPGLNGTCSVVPLDNGYATITAALENGESDTMTVRIRSVNAQGQDEESAPAALPEPEPEPAALDTFETIITVGSASALVNGTPVLLAGSALLYGDRSMVDFGDMAKLIPGLEVNWDPQTQTVTYSKDGEELKIVLDQVAEDYNVIFINLGGRLVMSARYVGSFFGANVDWIGDTLVVHMYK